MVDVLMRVHGAQLVCDGVCTPLPHTYTHDHDSVIAFWATLIPAILICILLELTLLMFLAVRGAVNVSQELDLRLTPLNTDRAFVAKMLVRAAFDMKVSEEETMGVQSNKESGGETKTGGRHPIVNILSLIILKGKVVLTGILFKQVTQRVAPYDTATWIKPYTGTVSHGP